MTDEELIARLRLYGRSEVAVLEAADRIEALTEQLAAARQDAKAAEDELEMQEQEACMMENDYIKLEKERDALEAKLATCEKYRDAYDEMGRIGTQAVRDLEAKLAGGVLAEYDDGSTVFLSGYAGGAAIGGAWSTLTLMEKAPDGTLREREYKAQGDWRATLAEIKGESHD